MELRKLCKGGVDENVDLRQLSLWKIGGFADLVVRPSTTSEVSSLMNWFFVRDLKPVVIGMTSNLLFCDSGLRVPCIQIGSKMSKVNVRGRQVEAQAGAWVPGLARQLMRFGLKGGEHFCGIPGTVGGLIFMNGGSQRRGIADNVVEVESVDSSGRIWHRNKLQCDFGYRTSRYQSNREVITSVSLCFEKGSTGAIRNEMLGILADRRAKFPRKEPSCGSVFKSDPVLYQDIGPPGAIIERLGFKGAQVGGAQVSPKHANFIVNTGDATAKDVLSLVSLIRATVEAETGHLLSAEALFVGSDGQIAAIS